MLKIESLFEICDDGSMRKGDFSATLKKEHVLSADTLIHGNKTIRYSLDHCHTFICMSRRRLPSC